MNNARVTFWDYTSTWDKNYNSCKCNSNYQNISKSNKRQTHVQFSHYCTVHCFIHGSFKTCKSIHRNVIQWNCVCVFKLLWNLKGNQCGIFLVFYLLVTKNIKLTVYGWCMTVPHQSTWNKDCYSTICIEGKHYAFFSNTIFYLFHWFTPSISLIRLGVIHITSILDIQCLL